MIAKILAKATHLRRVNSRYIFQSPIGSVSFSEREHIVIDRILRSYPIPVDFEVDFLLTKASKLMRAPDCEGTTPEDWSDSSQESFDRYCNTGNLLDLEWSAIFAAAATIQLNLEACA